MSLAIHLAESGHLPDAFIRAGIRRLCAERLKEFTTKNCEEQAAHIEEILKVLRASPIAVETKSANEQHYELPPQFMQLVMGKHMKYSSCFFEPGITELSEAERRALEINCERAEIADGMRILDLGCGWGSMSLFMADRYRNSKVTGLSNSAPQREFILSKAKDRGLTNLEILTGDISKFDLPQNEFDRVVSIEMFEHMRNYKSLLKKISLSMRSDAKLFVHIFCHKNYPYLLETEGEDNWLGKYFFTGGTMPSSDLFYSFQDDLRIDRRWHWSGTHYQKTAEAWLKNTDTHRDEILSLFKTVYGDSALIWLQRWRIFFMSCAELWGFNHGDEWFVAHYLFSKR